MTFHSLTEDYILFSADEKGIYISVISFQDKQASKVQDKLSLFVSAEISRNSIVPVFRICIRFYAPAENINTCSPDSFLSYDNILLPESD